MFQPGKKMIVGWRFTGEWYVNTETGELVEPKYIRGERGEILECRYAADVTQKPYVRMPNIVPYIFQSFLDQLNLPEEEYRKNGLMDFPRWRPYEYGRTFEYGTFTGPGWRMDDYVERAHDFIESKNEWSIAFSRYRRKKKDELVDRWLEENHVNLEEEP